MKMPSKTIATIIVLSIIAGCSTASKDIVPAHVSPNIYAGYDCEQVKRELNRLQSEINALTGKLDKNRENDNITTTAGILLFWPALFFLGGTKEQEARYAQLKGEYSALEQHANLKKCHLSNR